MGMKMSDFVTLTCPQCGAKLQITEDIERFACRYCGTEHLVRRAGGIVSLAPILDKLNKIDHGISRVESGVGQVELNTRKAAAELAITRVKQGLAEAEKTLKSLSENYQSVSGKKVDRSFNVTLFGTVGAFIGLPFAMVGLGLSRASVNPDALAIGNCGLVILGFTILVVILTVRGRNATQRKIDLEKKDHHEALTQQEAVVAQLRSELEHHLNIVSR